VTVQEMSDGVVVEGLVDGGVDCWGGDGGAG
jgi:hypothetical protein